MRFLLLGPLEVVDDQGQTVVLGGPKQRGVLAALLLHPNEVVGKSQLVDWLWDTRPPATAAHTVEVYISRLRRLLGTHQTRLQNVSGGYRLRVDAGELDTMTLTTLTEQAAALEHNGDLAAAASMLAQALGLFRGPIVGDLAELHFTAVDVVRLTNVRLALVERRAELELASGGGLDLVAQLEAEVSANPDRERLWELLATAHYRDQNQAAALGTVARARQHLAEHLGIDPGPGLVETSTPSAPPRPGPARTGTSNAWAAPTSLGRQSSAGPGSRHGSWGAPPGCRLAHPETRV